MGISSQAVHVTTDVARGTEGSETTARGKPVIAARAPGRPAEADIGWLSGIIDGEANLGIRHHRKGVGYSAKMEIVSTSAEMLGKCERVIKELGARSVRISKFRKRAGNKLGKKAVASCYLGRQEELLLVLRAVEPHLTEKRPMVQAVVQLLSGRKTGSPWTEEDVIRAQFIRSSYMPRAA